MQPADAASVSTRATRRPRRWLLFAVVATALLAAGCETQFHVTKSVTGGSSVGPFTVHIECTSFDESGPDDTFTDDIVFPGPTFPDSDDSDVFSYSIFGDCTITETVTAGATSVTISCVPPLSPAVSCGPAGPSLSVNSGPSPGTNSVDISVVNDFGPVTTTTTTIDPNASVNAGAVSAAPDFTG